MDHAKAGRLSAPKDDEQEQSFTSSVIASVMFRAKLNRHTTVIASVLYHVVVQEISCLPRLSTSEYQNKAQVQIPHFVLSLTDPQPVIGVETHCYAPNRSEKDEGELESKVRLETRKRNQTSCVAPAQGLLTK